MAFLRRIANAIDPTDNLRIVITRHAERADFSLENEWINAVQRNYGRHPRVSRLPSRSQLYEWIYDTPITIDGENQSMFVGQKLSTLGCSIDYCYSSPAYRSIQTANKILEGQGRHSVPIKIEPGLFECPAWYVGQPLKFMSPQHLALDRRLNVDSSYQPIYKSINPNEKARRYYERSRNLIQKIVKKHKRGGTILLSGHGGSIEAVTRGLRGFFHRHERTEYLINEAAKVDYCNFAILERHATTGHWCVKLPDSSVANNEASLSGHMEIPLFVFDVQQPFSNMEPSLAEPKSRSPQRQNLSSRRSFPPGQNFPPRQSFPPRQRLPPGQRPLPKQRYPYQANYF